MGLGATAKDMHVDDGELGRLTTNAGLFFGSSTNGVVTVTGITELNSNSVGTITLLATRADTKVEFLAAASSFEFARSSVDGFMQLCQRCGCADALFGDFFGRIVSGPAKQRRLDESAIL